MGYGDLGLLQRRPMQLAAPRRARRAGRLPDAALLRLARLRARRAPRCSPAAIRTARARSTRCRAAGSTASRCREITIADCFRRPATDRPRRQVAQRRARPALSPERRGFDEFAGFSGGFSDYYDYCARRERHGSRGGRPLPHGRPHRARGLVRAPARSGSPFFLMVAYNAPHFPMQAPQELVDGYLARGETLGAALTYAMIEVMDAGVGAHRRDARTSSDWPRTRSSCSRATTGPTWARSPASASTASTTACGSEALRLRRRHPGAGDRSLARSAWKAGRLVQEMMHFTDWLPTLAALPASTAPSAVAARRRATSAVLGRRTAPTPTRCGSGSATATRRASRATRRCATATGSSSGPRSPR